MIFTETEVPGAWLIDLEPRGDERGFFARAWCGDEFAAHGLSTWIAQANLSFSRHRGTLRGMHFQLPPSAEVKVVRCIRGAVHDVLLDLRPASPTHGRWLGVELSADNRRAVYIPEGVAHGFQTLTDDAEILYQVSASYAPELERGVRWDDPRFGIEWPLEPTVMSDRDRRLPDWAGEPALDSVEVPAGAGEGP